ncbi:hypothetical protein ACOMHN_047222 [Nucella lapillus]
MLTCNSVIKVNAHSVKVNAHNIVMDNAHNGVMDNDNAHNGVKVNAHDQDNVFFCLNFHRKGKQCLTAFDDIISTSKNIIYILWCSKCNFTQYVGETKTTLKHRFYKHYADIHRNTGTHVTNHFCQPGHSDSSLKCMPIEQLLSSPEDTSRRRRREFFWMTKLRSIYPLGLNAKE